MRLCSFRGSDGHRPGLVVGEIMLPPPNASSHAMIAGVDPIADGAPIPLARVMLQAPVVPDTGLGVAIGRTVYRVAPSDALDHVLGHQVVAA